eukprot:5214140-Heterocapsa_arctica.AAC.1
MKLSHYLGKGQGPIASADSRWYHRRAMIQEGSDSNGGFLAYIPGTQLLCTVQSVFDHSVWTNELKPWRSEL